MAKRMTAEQIAEDMEARIRSGEYPPGARLPTTVDLATTYGCGTTTATKVYFILRMKGLTEGMQGIGIYVRDDV